MSIRKLHDSGELSPSDLKGVDVKTIVESLKGVESLRLPFFDMCGREDDNLVERIIELFCFSDSLPSIEESYKEAIDEGHVQVVRVLEKIANSPENSDRISEILSWSTDITVSDSVDISSNLLSAGIEQLPLHTQCCGLPCTVISFDSMLPNTLTELDTLTTICDGNELMFSTKCLVRPK